VKIPKITHTPSVAHATAINMECRMCMLIPPNAAPHLPPPGLQVERKKDTRTRANRRAENAGGG